MKLSTLSLPLVLPLALCTLAPVGLAQTVKVDPQLPLYTPTQGVTGNVRSIGSDTMNNMMALWSEQFRTYYPSVQVEVQGKGSSTAPPALIEGTSTFGPMSRPMKAKEVEQFEKKFGYGPTALPTSIDMLGVFVHRDNPVAGLSLVQIDAIFSKTRNGGAPRDIVTWGDLGLEGEWADKPISIYGRNSASGTYGYFKDHALFKGDYKDTVKEQPGSSSVIQAIASDRYGIGYSGIGYKTADVRALPLAAEVGEEPVEPIAANAMSGDYPLARFLYLYVNFRPGSDLEPLRREFITYVYSQSGQKDVIRDGYYPVPSAIARRAMESVGLELAPPPPADGTGE